MDNRMFSITFPNVAYALQYISQSRNNNNGPNKKNDVITDLGGEGDFPMFLFADSLFRLSHLIPYSVWRQSTSETQSSAQSLNCE